MAFSFKDFLLLPGTAVNAISGLLFGEDRRNTRGGFVFERDSNRQPTTVTKKNNGLLGAILDGVKFVGRAISNFLFNHKQAISVAFWTSLALAGAAALTVFLWPAALAAVTTFTIAGYSIAGVVGANVLAQTGAVAAVAAVATSTAVYVTAGFVNTISAISGLFASRAAARAAATANSNGGADAPAPAPADRNARATPPSPQASGAATSYVSMASNLSAAPTDRPVPRSASAVASASAAPAVERRSPAPTTQSVTVAALTNAPPVHSNPILTAAAAVTAAKPATADTTQTAVATAGAGAN